MNKLPHTDALEDCRERLPPFNELHCNMKLHDFLMYSTLNIQFVDAQVDAMEERHD